VQLEDVDPDSPGRGARSLAADSPAGAGASRVGSARNSDSAVPVVDAHLGIEIGAAAGKVEGKGSAASVDAVALDVEAGAASKQRLGAPAAEDLPEEADDSKWGASWWSQVYILTHRCIRTRRFQALSTQRFAEVVVTAVLAGGFQADCVPCLAADS
jgi:hypothetical protein